MSDEQFDELSKALATRISRRQAVKLVAATAFGGALSLVGARGARADDPGRCRRVGTPCRRHSECCDFFCDPTTGRCACPPGTFRCRRTKRCVECRPPGIFNPETCQCECPEGTTPCDGTCCESGSECCHGYYGGFCCPPGLRCCPGGFCEYPPYYTCP